MESKGNKRLAVMAWGIRDAPSTIRAPERAGSEVVRDEDAWDAAVW